MRDLLIEICARSLTYRIVDTSLEYETDPSRWFGFVIIIAIFMHNTLLQ